MHGLSAAMDPRSLVYGITFSIIWSSAFTSAVFIVAEAPPFMALAFRFTLAAAIACLIATALGQRPPVNLLQLRSIALFGFLQNGVYLGLFFVAMQWIEASLAVVIAASLPLWTAGFAAIAKGERLPLQGIIGLLLGFSGVILVMGTRLSEGTDTLGVILCIVGVIALSCATMLAPQASTGNNLLFVVGLQSLIGAIPLFIISAVTETWVLPTGIKFSLAFGYTLLMPGLLAVLIWFALIKRIGTTRASAFHFLNPFFGVLIAALVLGEALRWADFLGVAIVMIGILAVQTARIRDQ